MKELDAYFLPKRSYFLSVPARVNIDKDSLTITSKKDSKQLFSAKLKDVRIGEGDYFAWIVLQNNATAVRVMFSDPAAATRAAIGLALLIIIGSVFQPYIGSFALFVSFAIFRPWFNFREGAARGQKELKKALRDSSHVGQIEKNGLAVDDWTKGTNRFFGGWREVIFAGFGALIASVFYTMAYYIGRYGPNKVPGNMGLVTFGLSFLGFFAYYSYIGRPISVEYVKLRNNLPNKFGKLFLWYVLPAPVILLVFVLLMQFAR